MANRNQVVGEARITSAALGVLPTDGQTTLDVGGPQREGVQGDYSAGAFRATTKEASLEVSLLARADVSPAAVRAIDNDTITIEFDTGRTFIMRNAWSSAPATIATNEGKYKVTFMGPPAEEIA